VFRLRALPPSRLKRRLKHAQPSPQSAGRRAEAPKPTIVLVHGAWADASGWNDVINKLQHDGYPVIAPANPLRSMSADSAYIAIVLEQTPGRSSSWATPTAGQ
jgi:pimeloyl-ACP methyl ester carboxylesterase